MIGSAAGRDALERLLGITGGEGFTGPVNQCVAEYECPGQPVVAGKPSLGVGGLRQTQVIETCKPLVQEVSDHTVRERGRTSISGIERPSVGNGEAHDRPLSGDGRCGLFSFDRVDLSSHTVIERRSFSGARGGGYQERQQTGSKTTHHVPSAKRPSISARTNERWGETQSARRRARALRRRKRRPPQRSQ